MIDRRLGAQPALSRRLERKRAGVDFRNFALSNIERVELLETSFIRRRDFSLQEYAERSFGVFQEEPFDVVWKFSQEVAEPPRNTCFTRLRSSKSRLMDRSSPDFVREADWRCVGTCSRWAVN